MRPHAGYKKDGFPEINHNFQSDNVHDVLMMISAFGIFLYASYTVIAGKVLILIHVFVLFLCTNLDFFTHLLKESRM